MINKIIDGMCAAIKTAFTVCDIYTEGIEQGLNEPCFFIKCINPTNELILGKRYLNRNQFIIQYFPSTNEPNSECYTVNDTLTDCMEFITVDGNKMMASGMQGEVLDGVLTFTLNYNLFTIKTPEIPTDKMEISTITVNAEG